MPAPAKVCFVLPATGSTNVGGMESVAANLMHSMDPQQYQFHLVCFEEQNGIIPRLDRSRVSLKVVPKKPGLDPILIFRLAAFFLRLRPDLIHTFGYGGLLYGFPAAKLSRIPALVHGDHGRFATPDRPLMRRVRCGMMRRAEQTVVVSEALNRLVVDEEGVSPEKVTTIINGIDLRPFDGEFQRGAYRDALGLGPEDWAVGSVGSLIPIKNHQLLIRAASEDPRLKVFLAGKGPNREALENLIRELGVGGRVTLLGERSDIPVFLRAMDVFCLPSTTEGTSLALLEAMAAALPVVATDVGGNGEVVIHERTGFLVPSQDLEALRNRLIWTCENRSMARGLGKAGRARVEEHYSFLETVEAYDRVFQRALGFEGGRGEGREG